MATIDQLKTLIKVHVRKSDMSDTDVTALANAAITDLHNDIPELNDGEIPDAFLAALGARGAYRYYLGDIGSVRDEKRAGTFLKAYRDDVFGGNPG